MKVSALIADAEVPVIMLDAMVINVGQLQIVKPNIVIILLVTAILPMDVPHHQLT